MTFKERDVPTSVQRPDSPPGKRGVLSHIGRRSLASLAIHLNSPDHSSAMGARFPHCALRKDHGVKGGEEEAQDESQDQSRNTRAPYAQPVPRR